MNRFGDKQDKFTLRDRMSGRWQGFKRTCVETSIEVVALTTLGAFSFGLGSCNHETDRNRYIPISFSEFEHMEDRAKERGAAIQTRVGHQGFSEPHGKLDPLTAYYAESNDMYAKVFEAWNDNSMFPRLPGWQRNHFARKLEEAMDSTTVRKYRHNLRDLTRSVPIAAQEALRELRDVQIVRNNSAYIAGAFDKAWDYSYWDSTHQECTTTTDSQGRSSTSCHTVCDFRHHTWKYYPKQGENAEKLLRKASQEQSSIRYLQMEVPENVHAWNLEVIRKSMRVKEKDVPLTEDEFLKRARYFKTGSAYEANIHDARGLWTTMQKGDLPAWTDARPHAKTAQATTGCYSTSGPREYELAQDIERRADKLNKHTDRIVSPMENAITAVPGLENDIKLFYIANTGFEHHFPEIKVNKGELKEGKLMKSVFRTAQQQYKANFPKGNDVQQFRWYMIPLWGLLGAAIGFGLGKAADYAVDRTWGTNRFYNNRRGRDNQWQFGMNNDRFDPWRNHSNKNPFS